MEKTFFDMYERQQGLCVSVGHNSISDWCIQVFDRKGKTMEQAYAEPCVSVQACDRAAAFASAYVKLTDYLSDTRGGY